MKRADAPAPSRRSGSSKARAIGQAELQRAREEYRAALKVTKRGIKAGLAEMRKKSA